MGRLAMFAMSLTVILGVGAELVAHPGRGRAYDVLTVDYRLNHVAVVGDSYTTGSNEGGRGPQSWTALAWRVLGSRGERVVPDVAAEGGAGYGVPGDHGSIFEDLTQRAVKPNDALVVFFGSRNDQPVDPWVLAERTRSAFDVARRIAPSAKFLVIGPPWPTADVPPAMLQIRDVLGAAAGAAGASFVDPLAEHWFVGRPDLIGADGVHPTDAGHAYMADKIAPLIGTQLST